VSFKVKTRVPVAERKPEEGGYFASLIKARVPAARERVRLLKEHAEDEGEALWPQGGRRRGEKARLLAAVEMLLKSVEDAVSRYGAPPLPPPRPPETPEKAAVELAMLLEDMGDFAEETGDPVLRKLAPKLKAAAAELASAF